MQINLLFIFGGEIVQEGKKNLFHLLKQVNPAFSQAEYASLEKKVAKSRSEVKMLLANFSCVLTLNHSH